MPQPFVVIQFPYRLLMFACVFGIILTGLILNNAIKYKTPFVYIIFGIAILFQYFTFNFVPPLTPPF